MAGQPHDERAEAIRVSGRFPWGAPPVVNLDFDVDALWSALGRSTWAASNFRFGSILPVRRAVQERPLSQARLRERHANGHAERKQWSAVALAIARMTGKRGGLGLATGMTTDAAYSTDRDASADRRTPSDPSEGGALMLGSQLKRHAPEVAETRLDAVQQSRLSLAPERRTPAATS
jgi:hypothetical protein